MLNMIKLVHNLAHKKKYTNLGVDRATDNRKIVVN